jgi:hypothetical protein
MIAYAIAAPGVHESAADFGRAAAIAQKHINRQPTYVVVCRYSGSRCTSTANVEDQPVRHDWGERLAVVIADRLNEGAA